MQMRPTSVHCQFLMISLDDHSYNMILNFHIMLELNNDTFCVMVCSNK